MMTAHMRDKAAPAEAVQAITFDEVYERHFDYVCRILARLAVRADVEDLAQEVFVVVHRRLGEFEGRAQITTWLFQIAYRIARAHARRQAVRGAIHRVFGQESGGHVSVQPERLLEDERARAVRAALDRLPFKKRSVLVLYEVEGWPCPRIAESLGIPVDTVYTRLHHARADLSRALARLDDEGGSR
jgi:RNA polymerase sigma-70 factor (ECF subfamily)